MSQSNVIFAAVFIAYLIFITMRGELPIYWGLLVRAPQGANPVASGAGANSTGGVFGNVAAQAAPYALAAAGA